MDMWSPTVKITVANPLKTVTKEIYVKIDTGFNGGLFLPFKVYIELGLHLFETSKVVASIATGELVELLTSRAIIAIKDAEYPCTAYTSLRANRSLLGLEILSKLRVSIDGKSKKVLIKDPKA